MTDSKSSSTSFADEPVVALIGVNPSEMSEDELRAFVKESKSLRTLNQSLKAKLERESTGKKKKKKSEPRVKLDEYANLV